MHFDLRRSTDLSGRLPLARQQDRTLQEVKVGDYDGVVVMDDDWPLEVFWNTDTHAYNLFVAGAESVSDLVRIAETIR